MLGERTPRFLQMYTRKGWKGPRLKELERGLQKSFQNLSVCLGPAPLPFNLK
jgi:hypothetical protein